VFGGYSDCVCRPSGIGLQGRIGALRIGLQVRIRTENRVTSKDSSCKLGFGLRIGLQGRIRVAS